MMMMMRMFVFVRVLICGVTAVFASSFLHLHPTPRTTLIHTPTKSTHDPRAYSLTVYTTLHAGAEKHTKKGGLSEEAFANFAFSRCLYLFSSVEA